VPKEHYRNLLEMDATSASQLFAQVPTVAQKVMKATKAAGMNIIANCEEIAGQTVFHTHVHLVPRSGSYFVVKNRQAIQDEVLDTTDRVEAIKDDLDIIQNSLQIIDQQKALIKEYQKDLTYKFKVLEKDFQTRMAILQEEKQG